MKFTEADDGHEIDVRVNDTFEVALPENRTAGFSWGVKSAGEPVCSVAHDSFENQSTVPGKSGIHTWTFKVDAPGSATIELAYGRRWEKAAPVRTYSLSVRAGA